MSFTRFADGKHTRACVYEASSSRNADAASVWIFWISTKMKSLFGSGLHSEKKGFLQTGPTQYQDRRHKVWNGNSCENKMRENFDVHKKNSINPYAEEKTNIYSLGKAIFLQLKKSNLLQR